MTIKSSREISIISSTPIWRNGSYFDDTLGYRCESYTHSIIANGGFDSASITIPMRLEQAEEWFWRGLGRDITTYGHAGVIAWNGFVNTVTLSAGLLQAVKGPMLNIVNRTQAVYQKKRYNTNPPIGGGQGTTDTVNDTDSQDRYGILEASINAGEGTLTQVESIRDVYLAENADPFADKDISFGRDSVVSVTLECVGYYHLFKKYIYRQTANADEQNSSAKIQAVMVADPSSRFSTNYKDMETITAQIQRYENDERDAWTVISEAASLGDGSGNRVMFGIYGRRQAKLNSIPVSLAYQSGLGDARQELLRATGALVYPWDARPGVWTVVNDFLVGQATGTSLRKNQRAIFIENVSYTMPYSLQMNGQQVLTLPQMLAVQGLGG